MHRFPAFAPIVVLAVVAVTGGGCDKGTIEEPAPDPNVVAPQPVVPGPVPSPTPPPAPVAHDPLSVGETPEPDMIVQHCAPWVPPPTADCPKRPDPLYADEVSEAIYRLKRERPELFDRWFVLDTIAYYNGVFANLYEMGFCASVDSNEVAVGEIGNNSYRENYQILNSRGMARTDGHTSACSR